MTYDIVEQRDLTEEYIERELRDYRTRMSHIEGFSTLTDANIQAVSGVVRMSKLTLF
jgi:hypothetical protein